MASVSGRTMATTGPFGRLMSIVRDRFLLPRPDLLQLGHHLICSTITLPRFWIRGQRNATLVRADGQVPLRVGIPDGGEARHLFRR